MRKAKTSQRYVIKNESGQFLAIYYGYSPEQAIANFWHDQNVQWSQFKSWRKPIKRFPVTAVPESLFQVVTYETRK